jgi:hypothetical protein
MDWVFVDGQRLTPYMAYQINRLKADFRRIWGVDLLVSSGIRTSQEQIDIFLSRYVTAANVRGRYVYDTRVWNGTRYYRVSSAGTVAVPSTSNHEVQGNNGAVDLRDSGRDAGVMTANTPRANWLRNNAHNYDMEPEGYNFREPWHYKVRNIFNKVPGGGSNPSQPGKSSQEEQMAFAIRVDKAHLFLVAPDYIHHIATNKVVNNGHKLGVAELTMRIVQPNDQWVELTWAEFQEQLSNFGIPKDKVGRSGGVYDPAQGKIVGGGTWSPARESTNVATWLKNRIGGSVAAGNASITEFLRAIAKNLGIDLSK